MKKLEDDIENDEIKEPEEAAKDMGMENTEDDGGEEEEEEDDDGEDEKDNDEEDDDNSISPVEIYIHRFKEPCKFFISSWFL